MVAVVSTPHIVNLHFPQSPSSIDRYEDSGEMKVCVISGSILRLVSFMSCQT